VSGLAHATKVESADGGGSRVVAQPVRGRARWLVSMAAGSTKGSWAPAMAEFDGEAWWLRSSVVEHGDDEGGEGD